MTTSDKNIIGTFVVVLLVLAVSVGWVIALT